MGEENLPMSDEKVRDVTDREGGRRKIEELRIMMELHRLMDRMIAHEPERRKAIRDAGQRLFRACVGDRTKAMTLGRIKRSLNMDWEILSILMELSEAETSEGRSPITIHTGGAAGKVERVMGKRWREAHGQWLKAGKVGRQPKEPNSDTIKGRIAILKKQLPPLSDSDSKK